MRNISFILLASCLGAAGAAAQTAPAQTAPAQTAPARTPSGRTPLAIAGAPAQAPIEYGSPAAAFAGGPIRLSKTATAALTQHFHGDNVPLVPQPFRGKLDAALLGLDWPKVEALKQQLTDARGLESALVWEQTRFIATGGIGIAELHARDLAATGATGLREAAAMLWLYAAAATLTDGHKCADAGAIDAHLERLRGPDFDAVAAIVRTLTDDRMAAMRDLAIRLETVLAADRTDDTMCRDGTQARALKPDPVWKPEAAAARPMLAKHLLALSATMRPNPVVAARAMPRPVPEKPAGQAAAPPADRKTETIWSDAAYRPEAVLAAEAAAKAELARAAAQTDAKAGAEPARPDSLADAPAPALPPFADPARAAAIPADPGPPPALGAIDPGDLELLPPEPAPK